MSRRWSAALGVVGVLALAATASAQELHLSSAVGPPYVTPAGDGILDRVLAEAGSRVGVRLVLQVLPAERALREADAGRSDGDAFRIARVEASYPNLVRVGAPTCEMSLVAYGRGPGRLDDGWQALRGRQVAFIAGLKMAEANTDPKHRTTTRTLELAVSMVARGRADYVVDDALRVSYAVKKLRLPLHRQEPPLAVLPAFVYLHRRHATLVPGLEAALRAMDADGTLARLVGAGD